MQPRPVPSECVDLTPSDLWGVLWSIDPTGRLELPQEAKTRGGPIRFWKNHWFKFQKDIGLSRTLYRKLNARFWQQYWATERRREDQGERVHQEWDESKHGYWRVNGRLQYRSPDGAVYVDVDGAGDQLQRPEI